MVEPRRAGAEPIGAERRVEMERVRRSAGIAGDGGAAGDLRRQRLEPRQRQPVIGAETAIRGALGRGGERDIGAVDADLARAQRAVGAAPQRGGDLGPGAEQPIEHRRAAARLAQRAPQHGDGAARASA